MNDLLAIALATYGLSWMLVYSAGPNGLLGELRKRLGVRYADDQGLIRYGETWVGELFNCPVCLSVWVSIPITLLALLNIWIIYPLAAVGAVTILTNMFGGGE